MVCSVVYWLLVDAICGGGLFGEWPRDVTRRIGALTGSAWSRPTSQTGPPRNPPISTTRTVEPDCKTRLHRTVPSRTSILETRSYRDQIDLVVFTTRRCGCFSWFVQHVAVPGRRHGLRRVLGIPTADSDRPGGEHQPCFHALLVRTGGSVCPLQTESSPRTRACYTYYLWDTAWFCFVFLL